MKRSFIGKRKTDRVPRYPVSVMSVMPVPEAWGDRPKPSSAHGMLRLTRGEIAFERLPVQLVPTQPPPPPPDRKDTVIGRLNSDNQRDILPAEIENGPEPSWDGSYADEDVLRDRIMTDRIRLGYIEQSKRITFRIVIEGMVGLFLTVIEMLPLFTKKLPVMFDPKQDPITYLVLSLVLSGFCAVLNRELIVSGFKKLFSGKPDSDTVMAGVCSLSLLHMISMLIWCIFVRLPVVRVCAAPMTLALLGNDIGLLYFTLRSARNFHFCALRSVRHSAMLVGRESHFDEIAAAGGSKRSNMVYTVRANHLSGYLDFASEEDFCEHMFSKISPYACFAAAASAVIGGLVSHSFWGGFYCLCAVMTIGAPICRLICINAPISRASSYLVRKGAMLNGWAAIDEFGTAEVLTVNSEDLFPRGSVRLYSVKAYGSIPVDDAMIYAASVVTQAGGPLSQVFEDLIEQRSDILPEAFDIRYENEMGVSGWVNDRPVLVGNRKMLELHGCEIPSKDYERLISKDGTRSPVYIAVSGNLAAVMLVDYHPTESTIEPVRKLVEGGVTLVIYTCDPNVTTEQISSIYGIPRRYISVLSTKAGSVYDELTHTVRDSAPAVLATDGRLSALAIGIGACRKLKGLLTMSTFLQLACYILGLMLVVFLCLFTGAEGSEPSKLIIMQLVYIIAALVPVTMCSLK